MNGRALVGPVDGEWQHPRSMMAVAVVRDSISDLCRDSARDSGDELVNHFKVGKRSKSKVWFCHTFRAHVIDVHYSMVMKLTAALSDRQISDSVRDSISELVS